MDGKRPVTDASRPDPEGRAAPPERVALLEGLARLFAVAAIYPATHVRVQALAGPVIEGLRQACPEGRALGLEVRAGVIHLDGERIPLSGAGAQRLTEDLDQLGVSRLEIDGGATLDDLLALARLLRARGQQRHAAASFQHAEVTGLPPSIRAIHQDFGAPTFDESGSREDLGLAEVARLVAIATGTARSGGGSPAGTGVGQGGGGGASPARPAGSGPATGAVGPSDGPANPGTPDPAGSAANLLADAGHFTLAHASDADVHVFSDLPSGEQLRALVANILHRAQGPVPAGADMGALGNLPKGRREILRAIAEALQGSVDRLLENPKSEGVDAVVQSVARRLEKVAPDLPQERLLESMRLAIDEHLRDAFRREAVAAAGSKRPTATREAVPTEHGVDHLLDRMEEFAPAGLEFACMLRADPAEHLAILLQGLADATTPERLGAYVDRLGGLFRTDWNADVAGVLEDWLALLLARADVARLDALLAPVLGRLREVAPAEAATLLLAPLRPPRPEPLLLLWPHLVDLLLRGLDEGGRRLEEEAIALLARLDGADLRAGMERLVALPAVRAGVVSRRLLQPPREDLYALYEVFLEARAAPHLGFQVLEAFFRYPPGTPAAGVLTVLRAGEDRARSFLARILRENHGTGETPALRQMCAATIAEAIRTLPARRRSEEWVVRAITALRLLPGPETTGLARQILSEKRFLFLATWPQAARLAARMIEARLQGPSTPTASGPEETVGPVDGEGVPPEVSAGSRSEVEPVGSGAEGPLPARRSA